MVMLKGKMLMSEFQEVMIDYELNGVIINTR